MESNKKIPHKAIVVVEYKVHSQQPDAFYNPMSTYDGQMAFTVDGDSEKDCREKLEERLSEMKKVWETT